MKWMKQIKRMLPAKYTTMLAKNKSKLPGALLGLLILCGIVVKQSVQADSTGRGALFGGLTGAAIGGAAGGGKGAGIGAAVGLATGALIGSAKDRDRSSDPQKQLDRLYKRRDKVERKMNNAKTESSRVKYKRELQDIDSEINDIRGQMYGQARRYRRY